MTVDELMKRMDELRRMDYMETVCTETPGAVLVAGVGPPPRVGWDWEPGKETHPGQHHLLPAKTSPETGNR